MMLTILPGRRRLHQAEVLEKVDPEVTARPRCVSSLGRVHFRPDWAFSLARPGAQRLARPNSGRRRLSGDGASPLAARLAQAPSVASSNRARGRGEDEQKNSAQ